MSLLLRRRMLLASQEKDINLIKLSADVIARASVNYEILSKNSINLFGPTNPTGADSRSCTVNFKITPNTKIRITFDYIRNYDNQTRVIIWKTPTLTSSSGTYLDHRYINENSREGSGIITLTTTKTANAEYIGISFYLNENSSINADAELLITNLKAEYVEE